VIDFVVSPNSMVWPMVPSGVSNDLIQIARDMTPDWEEED
jgi:acetolactate synthase I/II/III large subunit